MTRTVRVRGFRRMGDCRLATGHPAYDTRITVVQAQQVTERLCNEFDLPYVTVRYNRRKTKNLRTKLTHRPGGLDGSNGLEILSEYLLEMYPTGDTLGDLVHELCHLVDTRHKLAFHRLQDNILRWIDDQDMVDYLGRHSDDWGGSEAVLEIPSQEDIEDLLPDVAQDLCDRAQRDGVGGTRIVTRPMIHQAMEQHRIHGHENLAMLQALIRDGGCRVK